MSEELDKLVARQLTEQEAMFLRLHRNMSMREIARASGVSHQRVADVIKRAKAKVAEQEAVKNGRELPSPN